MLPAIKSYFIVIDIQCYTILYYTTPYHTTPHPILTDTPMDMIGQWVGLIHQQLTDTTASSAEKKYCRQVRHVHCNRKGAKVYLRFQLIKFSTMKAPRCLYRLLSYQ
ncbi:hypothetical protein BDZ91DRAFT_714949 [Kalaharituber pfeilii]|nr:hypothetical protein BDZ91DRAFT_714949 [Kalaharituber pfeilii]